MVLRFWKPYGVLCQFTDEMGRTNLSDFVAAPGVYAAGRLDAESEGLLLLTDDGALIAGLTQPDRHVEKTYLVQVEGVPNTGALEVLRNGVGLKDGKTRPAKVELTEEPLWLPPRDPPIRYRAKIPTSWLRMTIREGKNRQVRRMTAAVGHPTLRLVRWSIGPVDLRGLEPGEVQSILPKACPKLLEYRLDEDSRVKRAHGIRSKSGRNDVRRGRRKGNR